MSAQPPNSRLVGYLLFAVVLSVSLQSAFADTIYLKNGRVIRTEQVRVEGDRVIFQQFGSEVQIPLSLVERIVQDGQVEEVPTPLERREPEPEAGEAEAGEDATEALAAEGAQDDEGPPPEETREFWQERVQAIYDEQAQLEADTVELRREERAFLFSKRSTAETRRKIEALQARQAELEQELRDIRTEARQKGIPAGWLRVRRTTGN